MKALPIFIFLAVFPVSLFAADGSGGRAGVSARAGEIIEDIDNFLDEDDSKKEKIKTWFATGKEKSEAFRTENLANFSVKKIKLAEEREDVSEFSSGTKVLLWLHFYLLVLAVFVFSTAFIFYAVGFSLLFYVLRLILRGLKRVFRRRHEI